jgi:hypothetical protein
MVAMASQFCDADGHNCDSDKLFVTALYGERGSGHNRCSQAAFEWWTGGNETPDNYIMVDSSLHNPTSSLTEGGSIESFIDAWGGVGRPQFFFLGPGLQFVDYIIGNTVQGVWASIVTRAVPILDAILADPCHPSTVCDDCGVLSDVAEGGHTIVLDPSATACDAAAAEPPAPCGDVDSSGIVDVNDLLILLSEFNSEDPSTGDVNYDGVCDVTDLLLLLSQFGGSC